MENWVIKYPPSQVTRIIKLFQFCPKLPVTSGLAIHFFESNFYNKMCVDTFLCGVWTLFACFWLAERGAFSRVSLLSKSVNPGKYPPWVCGVRYFKASYWPRRGYFVGCTCGRAHILPPEKSEHMSHNQRRASTVPKRKVFANSITRGKAIVGSVRRSITSITK